MNTHKEKMIEMKTWLKAAGKEIRSLKKDIKEYQRKNNGCYPFWWSSPVKGNYTSDSAQKLKRLHELRREYTINHIAYSLARGKTLAQILPLPKDGKATHRWFDAYNMSIINATLLSLLDTENETDKVSI